MNHYTLTKKHARCLSIISGAISATNINTAANKFKKHITGFDPRPTTETGRDVMEDLNPESSRETTLLETINRQNAVLIDRIANYERRLYWAIIIVIGVMYYLLKG